MFTRFEQEVRILQTLRHPSIVQLVDVVYDSSLIFLIMEYCSRGELFAFIASHGRLTPMVAKHLFSQIVDAMVYIHARDIKPENVMLDENINAKIIDFGLCHSATPSALLETPCGTILYAPPELLLRQKYDGKLGDVWSLGVVLYAMMVGELPWASTNQQELCREICAGEFEVPMWVRGDARGLIQRMMQVDPANRPSMAQIAADPWLGERRERFPSMAGEPKMAMIGDFRATERRLSSGLRKPIIVRPNVSADLARAPGSRRESLALRAVPAPRGVLEPPAAI
jgi:serine/threonine protein kinase